MYEYDSSTDSEEDFAASEEDEEEKQSNGSISQDEGDEEESESEDFSWYDWKDEEKIYFTFITGEKNSYIAGSEIFNSYGRRTNSFLILHYGFAMMNNIYDSLTVYTIEDKPFPFKLKYNKLNEDLLKHIRA